MQTINILGRRFSVDRQTDEVTILESENGERFEIHARMESVIKQSNNILVVTRHAGLIDYIANDLNPKGQVVEVKSHATPIDIKGRIVVGPLPPELASLSLLWVTIPLNLTPELRGVELTYEQVKSRAQAPMIIMCRRIH